MIGWPQGSSLGRDGDSCDDTDARDLVAAYVLNAVSDAERQVVERHVAQCVGCAAELHGLQETSTRLGSDAVAQPSVELRERVLSTITRTAQLERMPQAVRTSQVGSVAAAEHVASPKDAAKGTSRQRRWLGLDWSVGSWRRLAVAAGAACLALIVGSSIVIAVQQDRLDDQRARVERQQAQADTDRFRIASVMSAPDARIHTASIAGGTMAFVNSRSRNEAVAVLSGLTPPGEEQTYQLWLIAADDIRSAGFLAEGSTGGTRLVRDLDKATLFGVTVEPAGGSDQPTMAPLATVSIT